MGNTNTTKAFVEEDVIDRVIFPKYSSEFPLNQTPSQPKAVIDKEHITISKIFRISLEEGDKFLYLELYLAQLLSMNKEPKFRISNLDDIILSLFQTDYKTHLLDYLFESFHRAIEMIEKRFRAEYDKRYKEIHHYISNYICLILTSPENLGLEISSKEAYTSLEKYLKGVDFDELGFLLYDFYQSTSSDLNYLRKVFSFYFRYMHSENVLSKPSFFTKDTLTKNMYILYFLFKKCPMTVDAYLDECMANNNVDGRNFQIFDYLAIYIKVVPFESDIANIKKVMGRTKAQREAEIVMRGQNSKLNEHLGDVMELVKVMYNATATSCEKILKWLYRLININMDKFKLYHNDMGLSSTGFMLNVLIILLKLFYYDLPKDNESYSKFIFHVVGGIDTLYTLTKNRINFSSLNRANPEIIQEVMKNDSDVDEMIPPSFNIYTELFFAIEVVMGMTLKTFTKFLDELIKKINEIKNKNESQCKDLILIHYVASFYCHYESFIKNLLIFSETSTFLIFSLNNKKYSQHEFLTNPALINYKEFLDDFYYHINFKDNFTISLLPNIIYENLITIAIFIKQKESKELIANIYATKALVYFSLIFSCNNILIQNPHFRMEIFDIMVYFFVISPNEKNTKITQIYQLLREKFIKDSLFVSIMRVFVDAERLGTSNQFYERFSVRHKILLLIDGINNGCGQIFEENIKTYANKYDEESTKMVNLLMNDLTYLNDECIERLSAIKKYQDLVDDKEKFNSMDEEKRKMEESKFNENDRIVRVDIRLFNSSLKFLVSISKVLQDKFMDKESQLGENLANLLNYSLNIFITPKGNEIKVKNLSSYEFNPKFVLASIISTYASFASYKEFIEYVVKDDRSYKYNNFIRAKEMVEESGKITVDSETFSNYCKLIEQLLPTEKEIKEKEINIDDAPEEFIDPITSLLMRDPVILPSSKVTVDRVTIEKHLLSDSTDPFNRAKLTKDMVIPDDNLRKRIDAYVEEKKKKK